MRSTRRQNKAAWQVLAAALISLTAGWSGAWAREEQAWSLVEQGPLSLQPELSHTVWETQRPPYRGGKTESGCIAW